MTNTSHSAAYFLAHVHAAVFKQHDLARLDLHAIDPVAHQRHRHVQQFGQALGHRRQRIFLAPAAFLRPPQVRGHHDRGALFQRGLQRRQRGGDALFGSDPAIFNRHVQILADQDALAGKVEVGHADDGHGACALGSHRGEEKASDATRDRIRTCPAQARCEDAGKKAAGAAPGVWSRQDRSATQPARQRRSGLEKHGSRQCGTCGFRRVDRTIVRASRRAGKPEPLAMPHLVVAGRATG
jgi:hypothetical protein